MERDVLLLKSLGHEVKLHSFNLKLSHIILSIFRQILLMISSDRSNQIIICQGAGYHSFIPSLLGLFFSVPVVIIAIGTDCVSYPSINYGSNRKKIYGFFTRKSFEYCKIICPVHKKLVLYQNEFYPQGRGVQGIKNFLPQLDENKIIVINNGFDSDKWKLNNKTRPSNSLLTVVGRISSLNYQLKGIDLIYEFAKLRKDLNFTIVGTPEIKIPKAKNVKNINFVSQKELVKLYNQNMFYLQLSISEGLPNSLCEAMLCGCIPIGSSNSSIPEIIGDDKLIVKEKSISNLSQIFEEIEENLNDFNTPEKHRDRIIKNYPYNKRLIGFKELLSQL
jgi:glycosyltransferase involved in cell wall biosynthesis